MYILAIDQGTTGTTSVLYDRQGEILARAYAETKQIYPKPGWVEHDPPEIWQAVLDTVGELLRGFSGRITAIGITNQRETTIIWDKKTGMPVYNAIVWQCRRSASYCTSLKAHEEMIRGKTGLPLDPYFSATKIRWILDHVQIPSGDDLLFGTVDSWLIWKLTGGAVHATDFTNASRTMLFDIERKQWDEELCRLFGVPVHLLPAARPSMADYGQVQTIPELRGVRISGVAGDQQASLFGQRCVSVGQTKNTYGTGCFIMMNIGQEKIVSRNGLICTLAVDDSGRPCFALEGSVFIAGAALQFLRDELKLIKSYDEVEEAARSVADSGGVYLVPALAGLGAPHWDMAARGIITGLTRGSNRNHLIRATLEAMAYQTHDVLSVMEEETGIIPEFLIVDGGAAKNKFLMQFQADIINKPVRPSSISESTSLGAAYLAGLQAGIWKNQAELAKLTRQEKAFRPAMDSQDRDHLIEGWRRAVRQARAS
ncbi:MAG: glycerol kinase GlpK [Smithellaceae bacterium]|nr:glycerol kinase GlpK [Smithellaceae bacterium]